MKRMVMVALIAAAAPAAAHAQTACSGINSVRKTWLYKTVLRPDNRCDPGLGLTCTIKFEGWLLTPTGITPGWKPAIIFLHGHSGPTSQKNEPCAIAEYFVNQGFAVFAPLRRGVQGNQTRWPGMRSTGVHEDDACGASAPADCQETYGYAEAEDLRDAMAWLKIQPSGGLCQVGHICPLVDAANIAIMGHSGGGIVSLYANALSPALGHTSVVDISGAVKGAWPTVEASLKAALDVGQKPVYHFQAMNEGSVEPVAVLAKYAMLLPRIHHAALFHDVPNYTGDPHMDFITQAAEVALWGPSVLAFLDTY